MSTADSTCGVSSCSQNTRHLKHAVYAFPLVDRGNCRTFPERVLITDHCRLALCSHGRPERNATLPGGESRGNGGRSTCPPSPNSYSLSFSSFFPSLSPHLSLIHHLLLFHPLPLVPPAKQNVCHHKGSGPSGEFVVVDWKAARSSSSSNFQQLASCVLDEAICVACRPNCVRDFQLTSRSLTLVMSI